MCPLSPPIGSKLLMCVDSDVIMGWEEVECWPVGLITKVWGELRGLNVCSEELRPRGGVVGVTMPFITPKECGCVCGCVCVVCVCVCVCVKGKCITEECV